MEVYVDFKDTILNETKTLQNRIDFLEIYEKQMLKELSDLSKKVNYNTQKIDDYIKETEDFFASYYSQSIFKKIWWNICKLNYKQLKEIKAAMLKPITDIQNKLDSLDSKQEMQNRAVLTLQRRSLLDSCERLLKQGYADLKDKEVIEKQFESYKELGGNSFVKELVVRVLNLPIDNNTI